MAAAADDSIAVQVAYARPERQCVLDLSVPAGTTAREAVQVSGISEVFGEIDARTSPIGIYGRAVEDEHPLRAGDRVEVYRPLVIDPKEARRQRARIPR
ncbi:RnfH family protein [Aquisalimonas sp.]|uniref:RnfH family protein n=1 Tax=unclassified Aquisalimonas TaxID=2644645 RepID=UPI0025BB5434|nr:RnfH family protein [Aquisalimonas sp.]